MKVKIQKKGVAFDMAPRRILFGNSELERKNHYKKQFNLLIKHWDEIPWRQWGVGSARSLSNLLREIGTGESVLVENKRDLVRKIDIVMVFVMTKNKKWLVEQPQEMYDGRLRNRKFPYISEKLRLGETPKDTALRAIMEESGGVIDPDPKRLMYGEKHILDQNHTYNTGSSSYPGLKSEKTAYTFAYMINKKEYKTRYTEVDVTGSVTLHSWKKMSQNVWFTDTLLEEKVKKLQKNR